MIYKNSHLLTRSDVRSHTHWSKDTHLFCIRKSYINVRLKNTNSSVRLSNSALREANIAPA
jgi:hypothetical protein